MTRMRRPPRAMHLRHQFYLPASLTANTNRSDSYFDGDEFDEFPEAIE